jgi:hypothetical protein
VLLRDAFYTHEKNAWNAKSNKNAHRKYGLRFQRSSIFGPSKALLTRRLFWSPILSKEVCSHGLLWVVTVYWLPLFYQHHEAALFAKATTINAPMDAAAEKVPTARDINPLLANKFAL